jgi:hypothetical protein
VKLSILISTHGSEEWRRLALRRAVPSAENQGSHEVLVLHEPKATLAEVRNANAEQATGDFLLYLDGDDELDPGFVEAISQAHAELPPAVVPLLTPSVSYVRGMTRKQPKIWPEIDIRNGNWMIIGTVVPRDLVLSFGGFREYGWSEDWGFWAMCMEAGATPVKVPEAIYVAHVNHKSRNRSRSRQEVLFWHQAIGHDVWPHIYERPTDEEVSRSALLTGHVRRLD